MQKKIWRRMERNRINKDILFMIPIIDVDPFLNDDFSSSDELLKALGREGLIFITTKHITQSTRLQVIDAAKELFNLPLRDKMLIPFDNLRGYISTGNESGGSQFEYKEGFAYGFESSTSLNKLSCQNQWPQNYKDIPILTRFYNLVAEICMSLMKALSHALNVDRSEWEEKFSNSISVSLMRLFHYYPSRNLDNVCTRYISQLILNRIQEVQNILIGDF